MSDYEAVKNPFKPPRTRYGDPLDKEQTTVPKGATQVPKPVGDLTPERTPKRVEGMETPYEPAAGHEPGGHIVSDAQRRALAPILGKNNGKGTSTDLHALGYTLDSIGRYHENGNLGIVESSDEFHQYMASKKDRISQNAIQATKSRLGRMAVKNGFGE